MKPIPPYIQLQPKRLHPLIPELHNHDNFIYFLIRRHRVIYVGQTQSLRLRVHHHNCYLDFDSIRWIPCEKENIDYYERRWIKRFQPKYNTMYTKRWISKNGNRIEVT